MRESAGAKNKLDTGKTSDAPEDSDIMRAHRIKTQCRASVPRLKGEVAGGVANRCQRIIASCQEAQQHQ